MVIQVNAYDAIHVVDALYRSKYFLTSMASICRDLKAPSWTKSSKGDDCHVAIHYEKHDFGGSHPQRETGMNTDDLHKVTILNIPEEGAELSNKHQSSNGHEGCIHDKVFLPGGDEVEESLKFSSGELCVPVLPWINGDGTINKIIYKGLRRRVLGIVMQNPGILEVFAFLIHVLFDRLCSLFYVKMIDCAHGQK